MTRSLTVWPCTIGMWPLHEDERLYHWLCFKQTQTKRPATIACSVSFYLLCMGPGLLAGTSACSTHGSLLSVPACAESSAKLGHLHSACVQPVQCARLMHTCHEQAR